MDGQGTLTLSSKLVNDRHELERYVIDSGKISSSSVPEGVLLNAKELI